MSDRFDRHRVLYSNRATPELYAVIREQAPPEQLVQGEPPLEGVPGT